MILQSCLLIKAAKFPLLKGEKEQLVNDGMVGKALCTYLQDRLPSAGIEVPFFCNESWGWLQTERNGFQMGPCVHFDPGADPDPELCAPMPPIRTARKRS
jgi:hypothetical protein